MNFIFKKTCRQLAKRSSCSFLSRESYSSYKSDLSLSNLYPKSSLSLTAPVQIPGKDSGDNSGKFTGYIPIEELQISYCKSSGPGGQHVNKTSSKVDIRFHVASASWLSNDIKSKILEVHKTKINKDGFLISRSEKTRSQIYNQADAMTNLREMIRAASKFGDKSPPSEETLFLKKQRLEKANMERLKQKRARSAIKASRSDQDT